MTDCSITGCAKPHKARGLCAVHYARHRRHGDSHTVKRPGRPRDPGRAAIEAVLGEDFGSRRTIERYHRANNILNALAAHGLVTAAEAAELRRRAIELGTRPNGTLNVSRVLEYAEDQAAIILAHLDDDEDA
ncbi:hypothetical protein [Mycobacterium sp. 852014-52144_SCH5372336]|uniref:hypothetical protein n=1 Tax=Mycobacterium sp. 852014-52144_SCH5372336 TaxID=1834115 RepID=UPI000800FD62|nr:hypothetical protein [Mycobacterium sp. 852014-52144_SCH5372336]OBB76806.1 hypothetical protein A5759_05215 [Mycobacterium sp. 852014-52144_SCH5372336]